ncbi:uncharacterized protein LOC144439042 isoform X2 [Glandiceps talaboti]
MSYTMLSPNWFSFRCFSFVLSHFSISLVPCPVYIIVVYSGGAPLASCTAWGQTFWKDRWCVLKKRDQQYFLEYYKNEWATKPRGKIDLSKCQQVMEGLEFENRRNLESSHIFNIVTQKRTYFLVTTSEDDMRRWVQNLCRVCGFKTDENEHSHSQAATMAPSRSEPISIPSSGSINAYTSSADSNRSSTASNEFRRRSPSKAVSPLPTPDPGESYIHLNDCITGTKSPDQSLEETPGSESHYKKAPAPRPMERQVSTHSTSSIPECPPPPPPPMKNYDRPPPPIAADETYDVPPLHSPLGLAPIDDSDGIYKYVPPPKPKFDGEDINTDVLSTNFERQLSKLSNATVSPGSEALSSSLGPNDSYDTVPPPRMSLSGQGLPQIDDETNGNAIYDVPPSHNEDVYDVPPSHMVTQEDVYDVPPSHTEDVYDVPPCHAHRNESPDLYDVPPSHQDMKLLNSSQLSSSTNALAQEFTKISKMNQQQKDDMTNESGNLPPPTPPRPPKTKQDVDDEYVYLVEGTANQSNYDIVPTPRPAVTSPKTPNAIDIPVPPPRPPKPPTIMNEVSHSPNVPSTPPPSFDDRFRFTDSTLHQGVPEAELTHRLDVLQTQEGTSADSSATEDDYDIPPSRQNQVTNQVNGRTYLDTKIPPPPTTEYQNLFVQRPGYVEMRGAGSGSGEPVDPPDTYVPMSNELEEDVNYTPMGGALSHPTPPPASQLKESRRSVQPTLPPPVNRKLKPKKYQSMGDLPKDYPRSSHHRADCILPPVDDEDRDRSDTMDSSSSSSDGDKDAYETMQPKGRAPVLDNLDLYMRHDPRHQIYQNSDDLRPPPTSPPPPPPAARKNNGKKDLPKKSGEVQYIDLDLDEPTDQAPPRPPRITNSSEIEYTSLDMERTKGLEKTMRVRQDEISKES